MLPSIRVNENAKRDAAATGYLEATELADYLSGKGIPFREAHEITGKIVRHCIEHDLRLPELTLEEYRAFSDSFDRDVFETINLDTAISRRDHIGGTAPSRVRAALRKARRRLAK